MPFKRLKPKAYEGTGIGLPICKKIVELHGGRIKASGAPGEGATFSCLLPAPLRPDSSKRLGAGVAEGEPV
jgi:signal transduction histidine kinase